MPKARRRVAQSRPLLWAPLLLVVGMMLVGSSTAAATHLWKAPYKGSLHMVHHATMGPCGSTKFGGLTIDRTNGHVNGAASTGSSATCSSQSSSSADIDATVGLTLRSFTGLSGIFIVVVHFTLDFKVDLSISGSNCQPGTYAIVDVGFGIAVFNVSNGSPAASGAHSFPFKLTSVGGAIHLISQPLTVRFNMMLDSSVTYEAVPGASIALGTDAPAPASPATSTCGADASLKAGSTHGLAILTSAVLL